MSVEIERQSEALQRLVAFFRIHPYEAREPDKRRLLRARAATTESIAEA
jgi:hypothetical protein